MPERTYTTFAEAIDALCKEHEGAMIDRVGVIIDDCAYTLTTNAEGKVVGTDSFTSIDEFLG